MMKSFNRSTPDAARAALASADALTGALRRRSWAGYCARLAWSGRMRAAP